MEIAMKRQGYTQKDLAEKLGTSQANLSKKFKFNDWRESDVKKICSLMGINAEIILKFEDGTTL
jgi:transcriptional regulator